MTGFCYGTLYPGEYGHTCSEVESVTKMWWNFYGGAGIRLLHRRICSIK